MMSQQNLVRVRETTRCGGKVAGRRGAAEGRGVSTDRSAIIVWRSLTSRSARLSQLSIRPIVVPFRPAAQHHRYSSSIERSSSTMSRFKIKLRLPEQDSPGAGSASIGSTSSPSSSSANPTAAAPSAPSAATAPAAAEGLDAPTPLTSQAMRDNDRASSSSIQPAGITQRASQAASGGEGDVSMAASSSE